MSPRQSAWSNWSAWGAAAVAGLAALALAVTVLASEGALESAAGSLVAGEGHRILSRVHDDMRAVGPPPSDALMAILLARYRADGLRYVAAIDPGGKVVAEAGEASIPAERVSRGQPAIVGSHVRMIDILPPPGVPDADGRLTVAPRGQPGPLLPMLAVEVETPLVATLSAGLHRTFAVALVAVAVLLAVAIAMSHEAQRWREVEQERRLAALGRMSSVLAHELKNPLASLKGHAQLLGEVLEEGTRARAKADRVVGEAVRMEALVRSLLDFVRDAPLERAFVDRDTLLALARENPSAAARLEIEGGAAPARLFVDGSRVALALANLVRNALQASPGEAKVHVRFTTEGADAAIEVRDHGPGIPRGEEERIFEPFVTTRTKGTGLGLAVVRRIAEQHGGVVDASSHPGGGAVLRLVLPGAARSE